MGSHPLNLVLRFLLEIVSLIAIGHWSFRLTTSSWKYMWVIGIPLVVAIIWGIFNVPGDPSRSGAAPVVVPGLIRLIIELAIFGFASWTLFATGHSKWGVILVTIVLGHYLISWDRVNWLLQH